MTVSIMVIGISFSSPYSNPMLDKKLPNNTSFNLILDNSHASAANLPANIVTRHSLRASYLCRFTVSTRKHVYPNGHRFYGSYHGRSFISSGEGPAILLAMKSSFVFLGRNISFRYLVIVTPESLLKC